MGRFCFCTLTKHSEPSETGPDCEEPLAHYFLSRYSPGTSSCGTSCVRTSFSSLSPACSTPVTASASNAFPSSINSDTLSESAPSMLDNPCKSPDCPPLALRPSGANASVSTLWLFLRTRVRSAAGVFAPVVFLPRAFVFTTAFFKVGFFFANFFFGAPLFLASFFLTVFFIGFPFFPANPFGFVRFLFSFVLGHTRSLPPAHACPRNRARCIARKPTGPVPQFRQYPARLSESRRGFPLGTRMAPKTLVCGENLALASGLCQAMGMAKKRTKADRLERQTEQVQKKADRRPDKIEKRKTTARK
jgi:hypothetical protein